MMHTQDSDTGATFGISSRRGDALPTGDHPLPPGRVLVLTSHDAHGYKSAHRALAKRFGWTRKEHEHRHYNAQGALVVHTYWLPPVDVATSDLAIH